VLTATDNCDGVAVDFSEVTAAGACANSYTVTRTWSVSDCSGNSTSHTQVLTVEDTTAPSFTFVPADYTAECDEALTLDAATASDNCGAAAVTVSASTEAGDCTNEYVMTRTFTATDACGNTSTATQVITVIDTTAPSFLVVPADYTVECDGDVVRDDALAVDNCGTLSVVVTEETVAGACANAYTLTRTFTATDACGNEATAIQVITVEDTTAPSFTFVPADYTTACDAVLSLETATASDNCGDVDVTVSESTVNGDCANEYTLTRTFTATDACGNTATATQVITVEDTTIPAFTFVPADYIAECDQTLSLEDATATDNCGDAVVTVTEITTPGACANEYTLTRTFRATDACGNLATAVQVITVEDTTVPNFTFVPADYTTECDQALTLAEATATDNCGGATVTVSESTVAGDCPSAYTLTRTFTATDACGNTTTATQVITVEDTTAPSFTFVPADYTAECTDALSTEVAGAIDNCGNTLVSVTEVSTPGACPGEATVVRTFTATDECGNSATATQTITIVDTTAPAVADSEGVADGSSVAVCCEDIWGSVTIPGAIAVEGVDACGSAVTVDYSETVIGDYAPSAGIDGYCSASTPEALEDGLTCDNYAPHAARLFNFPGAEFYTLVGGTVTNYTNGTRELELEVVAANNPNAGWTFHIDLNAGNTWTQWLALPGAQGYKSDCGFGNHTQWMYHIMNASSHAEGWGDYSGSQLNLSHQPANGYFGFQMGVGANNKNANNGFSGWFYYQGTFNGASVIGTGDVFGDTDCCLPWSIERTYTLSDCAGNTSEFSYTIDVNGPTCAPILPPLAGDDTEPDFGGTGDDEDVTIDGGEGDDDKEDKSNVKVLGVTPNPTSDIATLTFAALEDDMVTVDVLSMAGVTVAELYTGRMYEGTTNTLTINASALESGLYQVRIITSTGVTTVKLMVSL
jgi:hypothetical protein